MLDGDGATEEVVSGFWTSLYLIFLKLFVFRCFDVGSQSVSFAQSSSLMASRYSCSVIV